MPADTIAAKLARLSLVRLMRSSEKSGLRAEEQEQDQEEQQQQQQQQQQRQRQSLSKRGSMMSRQSSSTANHHKKRPQSHDVSYTYSNYNHSNPTSPRRHQYRKSEPPANASQGNSYHGPRREGQSSSSSLTSPSLNPTTAKRHYLPLSSADSPKSCRNNRDSEGHDTHCINASGASRSHHHCTTPRADQQHPCSNLHYRPSLSNESSQDKKYPSSTSLSSRSTSSSGTQQHRSSTTRHKHRPMTPQPSGSTDKECRPIRQRQYNLQSSVDVRRRAEILQNQKSPHLGPAAAVSPSSPLLPLQHPGLLRPSSPFMQQQQQQDLQSMFTQIPISYAGPMSHDASCIGPAKVRGGFTSTSWMFFLFKHHRILHCFLFLFLFRKHKHKYYSIHTQELALPKHSYPYIPTCIHTGPRSCCLLLYIAHSTTTEAHLSKTPIGYQR
ncbi:hypothetical protein BX666DRAFT_1557054 [Dichotomocladium elegans]|nr:hypothetical protein BX666DRAFT_1557054 [Dichotomocladium elegans]